MTPRQRLETRSAEIRSRLNELAIIETPTDENLAELTELRTEYSTIDQRMAALIMAESTPPGGNANGDNDDGDDGEPETRDDPFARLVEQANCGEIFAAALEVRSIDGATRELQQELKLNSNQVPLELLETRAVTPAPDNQGRSQAEIIPYVFPMGMAAFLGVPQPSVPVGERVYPVLTTPASPGTPAKSGSQDETTGAFETSNISPARIQASFFYTREDAASFAGMDAALRANLSDAMSDKLDQQVVAGIIAGGKAIDKTAAVWAYKLVTELPYDGIDGRFASVAGDTRIGVSPDTYRTWSNFFSNATTELAPTALQRVMAESGGIRVGAHIPGIASKKVKAIARLGNRQDAVAPIWQGITLIPDEITKADTGEIVLTSVMLYGFAVLRNDPFRIVEYKTAA